MGDKETTLFGYHGTTRDSANNILLTNNFYVSEDDEEWLGPGVYFFENDIKQAYYYCIKAKKYKSWAILKSKITAEKIIDLIDTETFECFNEIAKEIKDRYWKRSDRRPRKLLNSVILNIMYKANPYDVVRGIFPVPPTYIIERTNVTYMQIQICVRNKSCIKEIMEVQYNGC